MKYKILLATCITGWMLFAFNNGKHRVQTVNDNTPVELAKPVIVHEQATSIKEFVRLNDYNSGICFLINMSLPSGYKRFFIYDLKKDSVVNAGLVTHGNCYQYWLEGRRYSNKVGSGCTSLGKYRVGKSYFGRFGLAYKLYGLDSTNNNALKRFVVMHSHTCVPDEATTDDICQSNGCPTVSPFFLRTLQAIVDKSPKPLLLYIYQ